jgi:mRNA interferase MazF
LSSATAPTWPDLIVMAVTSQLRPDPDLGETTVSRWQAVGLLKLSVVKAVFATLEQRLALRRLGAFVDDDRTALRKAIAEIIS